MSQQGHKIKVALKYCGSCNPYVSLTGLAYHLAHVAEERGDFQLVPLSENDVDVVVILCGCPRACGDKEEVKARAKHNLVVAGESIKRKPVAKKYLQSAVEQELVKILEQFKTKSC